MDTVNRHTSKKTCISNCSQRWLLTQGMNIYATKLNELLCLNKKKQKQPNVIVTYPVNQMLKKNPN